MIFVCEEMAPYFSGIRGLSHVYENLTSFLQCADDGFYISLIRYRYRTKRMVLE